jgi:hypothetical protein
MMTFSPSPFVMVCSLGLRCQGSHQQVVGHFGVADRNPAASSPGDPAVSVDA